MTANHSVGFGQLPEAPLLSVAWSEVHRWFAYRLNAKERDQASDLTNETMKRYIAKRRREPDWAPDHLVPWLISCANKVMLSYLARRDKREKREPAVEAESLERAASELASREQSLIFARYVEQAELEIDRRTDLNRAIRQLPDLERKALVAYEVEERTLVQIGQMLGVSSTTVHRAIKRARDQLRSSPLLATYGSPSGTQSGGGRA